MHGRLHLRRPAHLEVLGLQPPVQRHVRHDLRQLQARHPRPARSHRDLNAVKGISALQLGRDLDVQYKTAFVLAHTLREAIGAGQEHTMHSGHVEIGGAYVGGTIRQENRKDRRLAMNQTGKRQVVVVMRERGNGGRALPFVFRSEDDEALLTIRERVAPGTVVYADEARLGMRCTLALT